jgi:murein DD-endopeptidase MepM/ murein hydrolase activator NlpD
VPSFPSPQHAQARRAFIEDVKQDKKGWLQHGVAALAVSLLGLGVAGSIALTGNAQNVDASQTRSDASASTTTSARDAGTSRSTNRAALDPAKVKSLADQRAEELNKDDERVDVAATDKAAAARDKKLKSASEQAQEQAAKIAAGHQKSDEKSNSGTADGSSSAAAVPSGGKTCLPAAHYSVAARFGQVGSWARYHTGFDFSAPIGTTLRAPASGVVTNAGGGPASGWAGNYVAIKYSDGTQSLMAHMSTVSVSVGQTVNGCQVVGAIGMTGRSFGPHVHFEIYPAGITPGDVYKAVDPVSWLKAHGLNP